LQLNEKGQLQLEAVICIALIFALVSFALAAVNSLKSAAGKNNEMLLAEAKAQKCSMAANLLFSNGAGRIEMQETCYGSSEHEVKSVFSGREKSAFSVAGKVSSVQTGEKTVLEVKVDEHYR
jgi:hypothetical protein